MPSFLAVPSPWFSASPLLFLRPPAQPPCPCPQSLSPSVLRLEGACPCVYLNTPCPLTPSSPCQVCPEVLASAPPSPGVEHPLRPWLLVFSPLREAPLRELLGALFQLEFMSPHYSRPVTKNRALTAETAQSPEMREGAGKKSRASSEAQVSGFSDHPLSYSGHVVFTPSPPQEHLSSAVVNPNTS